MNYKSKKIALALMIGGMLVSCGNSSVSSQSKQGQEAASVSYSESYVDETGNQNADSSARQNGVLPLDRNLDSETIDNIFDGDSQKTKLKKSVNKDSTLRITSATLCYDSGTDLVLTTNKTSSETETIGIVCWWQPQANSSAYTVEGGSLYLTKDANENAVFNENGYMLAKRFNDAHESYSSSGRKNYYCLEGYMTADKITEYVYARAYSLVDGVYYYSSQLLKYSVKTYCYDMAGESESLKNYTDSILSLCAQQQGHDVNYYVTNPFKKVTVSNGKLSDGFTTGLYISTESVELKNNTEWITENANGKKTLHANTSIPVEDLTFNDGKATISCQTGDYTRGLTVVDGVLTRVPTDIDNLVIPDFVTSINCYVRTQCYNSIRIPANIDLSSGAIEFYSGYDLSLYYGDMTYQYYCDSTSWKVLKIGGDNETVQIPNSIFGYDVKDIDKDAIKNVNLNRLEIHESTVNSENSCLDLEGTNVTKICVLKKDASDAAFNSVQFTISDNSDNSGKKATLSSFALGSGTSYEIPEKIFGIPVTEIGSGAFAGAATYLTTLKIPSSIKKIGSGALCFNYDTDGDNCYDLTEVLIDYGGKLDDWMSLAAITNPTTEDGIYCYTVKASSSIVNISANTTSSYKIKCSNGTEYVFKCTATKSSGGKKGSVKLSVLFCAFREARWQNC